MPFLIFFVVWGLLELLVLIEIAAALGALATIALMIFSAFLGSALIRRERTDFARQMARANPDTAMILAQMQEGVYRLVAGVLLILPGFVSDLFALCLLFSPLRRLFGASLLRVFKPELVARRFRGYHFSGTVYEHENTVDARRKDTKPIEGSTIEHDTKDTFH